ncbi:MAG: TetR family transcriptional regulator [Robiginitomaculum sp.]|nr:MAG: TetR family transcriptional regulator [Robiginitomaculum sp.]
MTRFSKIDWLDLGLKRLAQEGPIAIRIDGLCTAAGRTKGSFYHHFKDREDFVSTLLARWEQTLTQNVIAQADREEDPVARLTALNKITMETDMGVERALRRWAGADAQVERAIKRVDKRRVEYVASLLQQAKNISSQQAIDLAVMNYAYLVGFQQIYTPVSAERRTRIDRMYVQILERLPNHD